MCQRLNNGPIAPHARRAGLTLIELLMAMAVMSIVVAALGMLASAVQSSNEYTQSHGIATQHARVTLGRIKQKVAQATASEDFPGIAVFTEQVGSYDFPDTLVVWAPNGTPANATGPPLGSTATWRTELSAIKSSASATKTVLTDHLRTALASATSNAPRGVVRFAERILPSPSDWSSFKSGSLAWQDIPWAQGIHGSSSGLRQSWCRIELQLVATSDGAVSEREAAIPFFGSAALYYDLER